jgi:hypothetical protein
MGSLRGLSALDRGVALAAIALALAGVLVLAVVPGFAASVTAAVLLGLAGILAVALAFLIVGESEERDRDDGRL